MTTNAIKAFFIIGVALLSMCLSGRSFGQSIIYTNAQTSYTPYTFSTLAGLAGGIGYCDGSNSFARFNGPGGLAVDSSGNLYVPDGDNYVIRKITLVGTNWVVTTLAGEARVSGSADGTNSNARFGGPISVALDSAGNLYVADQYYNTIRKITSVGTNWIVTTIAGSAGISGSADGTGSFAQFDGPYGIAVDSTGNVYVADSNNNTIRKIKPVGTNWVVTTFAGTAGNAGSDDGTGAAAQFDAPTGIGIDISNNLYVADNYNFTIRMITPTMVVTTIVGTAGNEGSTDGTNGDASFYDPQGVAVNRAGTIYVGDGEGDNIRKITPVGTNWIVTTLAGSAGIQGSQDGTGTNALFNVVTGVAVNPSFIVFVADSENCTVRQVTPLGVVTTLVGKAPNSGSTDGINGVARFYFPTGVALDGATNVYVADSQNNTIRKITPEGTNWSVTTIAGMAGTSGSDDGDGSTAQFYTPTGVAVDSATNIYVADTSNDTIRKITPAGTSWDVTTIAGTAGINGAQDGTNTSALFYNPTGVAVDSTGNVYIADSDNYTIRKITPAGTNWVVTTIAGTAGTPGSADGTNSQAQFNTPSGVAVDSVGNVYVADSNNLTIRKITPAGTNWIVTTIAGHAGGAGNGDGNGNASWFFGPSGIAVDKTFNVYVGDTFNDTIRKITPVGTNWVVTTLAGMPLIGNGIDGTGAAALFSFPTGVVVDKAGNVFVADVNNNTIRRGVPLVNITSFQISSLVRSNNDIHIRWTTSGGTTNVVQVTPGAAGGGYSSNNFVNLSPMIFVSGSGATSTNYIDAGGATNKPARYYRVGLIQ